MEPKMLTGAEVAELLRVSCDTVYRLAAQGELPGRKFGRLRRSSRCAIEECLRRRNQAKVPHKEATTSILRLISRPEMFPRFT